MRLNNIINEPGKGDANEGGCMRGVFVLQLIEVIQAGGRSDDWRLEVRNAGRDSR